MKKLDYGMLVVFLIALFVISFFWKCQYDPMVTVLGIVIAAASGFTSVMQYKKIKELNGGETE